MKISRVVEVEIDIEDIYSAIALDDLDIITKLSLLKKLVERVTTEDLARVKELMPTLGDEIIALASQMNTLFQHKSL